VKERTDRVEKETLPLNTIIHGDALDVLLTCPNESVNCIVTSPPYWGLRDYNLEPQIWGGDPACRHEWAETVVPSGGGNGKSFRRDREAWHNRGTCQPGFCSKCGAWLGSFGLEPTPELYVKHSVQIFSEVRRVMRKDGTLWLNIGDSYAAGGREANQEHLERMGNGTCTARALGPKMAPPGLKPKDLVGIPWRIAFALQADGWYLRSDIIWHKPNPMPESVTDRPTKAHEYIFLMSKSERYYYDANAITEKSVMPAGTAGTWRGNVDFKLPGGGPRFAKPNLGGSIDGTRNKRSVWTVATRPFPEAHFATFPEKLVEPCIKAGCPEGGVVLDPFGGSGTVGVVAKKLFRNYVLIDLNPDYCAMTDRRIERECGGLF
jgi:DNA modification methylase